MTIQQFFSELQESEDRFEFPASCRQGRTMFGGLIAAALYQSVANKVAADRNLRSMMVSFIGPLASGSTEVSTECLRQGSSVSQWHSRLLQKGKVGACAEMVFGKSRNSLYKKKQTREKTPTTLESCEERPFIENVSPEFTKQYDYRWGQGSFPFSGSKDAQLSGWIRHHDWNGDLSLVSLIALMDAWPAPVLSLFDKRAPASSVSWMFQTMGDIPKISGSQFVYYSARSRNFSDGYAESEAELWSAEGQLLLKGTQLVAYFA
ncbi:MAG: thioesterase family protein [Planctomycetota bacterium]|nr:thioesterase family protein [Planctomycetota bacterium]